MSGGGASSVLPTYRLSDYLFPNVDEVGELLATVPLDDGGGGEQQVEYPYQ